MTEIIAKSYFNELANADHQTICRNRRCSYSEEDRCYTVDIWDWQFLINPAESKIEPAPAAIERPHEYMALFCMYYLLHNKHRPLQGEWISEKDFPGGPTFFRGPHLIPTNLISNRFGNDLQAFSARCRQLGGRRLEMADASFRLDITVDIPVALLYWIGDEDFPAEAKILYDRSLIDRLTPDILFALAVGVCHRIAEAAVK
ncbi:MAG: DUF3786 domain-containing protein [Desulforhopalus sp.]